MQTNRTDASIPGSGRAGLQAAIGQDQERPRLRIAPNFSVCPNRSQVRVSQGCANDVFGLGHSKGCTK